MLEKSLISLENEIWQMLNVAVSNKKNPFKILCLCTTGIDGFPESRMVVMREAHPNSKIIEVHTDSRSDKYPQLLSNPNCTLLFYDSESQRQIRMRASAKAEHRNDISLQVLNTLSVFGKNLYGLEALPGTEGNIDIQKSAIYFEKNSENHFVVIRFKILSIDFLQLGEDYHKRASLGYQDDSLVSAGWIMP
jgi:hypothetical protein